MCLPLRTWAFHGWQLDRLLPYIANKSVHLFMSTPQVIVAPDKLYAFKDDINVSSHASKDSIRQTIESRINFTVSSNKPGVPPMHIHNNIDDEAVPPWQFHYFNTHGLATTYLPQTVLVGHSKAVVARDTAVMKKLLNVLAWRSNSHSIRWRVIKSVIQCHRQGLFEESLLSSLWMQ